jgi:hypothetical protein
VSFANLDSLDLKLHVNPAGMISASFVATVAGVPKAPQLIGPPVALPSAWFAQSTAPAVGIIATRGAAPSAPSVTWDFMRVRYEPINQPPVVNAGADITVPLGFSAQLNGTVSDDGLPLPPVLTSTWSKLSGPGSVIFADPTSASTTANFSALGSYVLRLSSSDGQSSSFDDLIVTVTRGPHPRLPSVGTQFSSGPPLRPSVNDLDPDETDDLLDAPSTGHLLA